MELLETSTAIFIDNSGKEREFILSKFPAIQGREIIAKYPVSNMPKLGDYQVSQDVMLKLMSFVAVKLGESKDNPGIIQRLSSIELINNHVCDWEMLAKIEMAMMEKNCSFFRNGRISTFLNDIALKSLPKILRTLMDSLAQLSPAEKQP